VKPYTVGRIVLECYFILLIAAVFSLLAGFLLQGNLERIMRISLLVALVPPLNNLGGSIGCIVGSRMGTVLHLSGEKGGRKQLGFNLSAGLTSGILSFLLVGMVLLFLRPLGFSSLAPAFVLAGLLQTAFSVFVSAWLAFISFREGLDPDNVVAPLITSFCDVTGVASLLLAARLLGL